MRVLVLSNLYPPHYVGGYELRCRDVTEQLHQRGHTVQVLTSNHQTAEPDQATDYPVSRSLRLHGFFGHPWLGVRELKALEEHNNACLITTIERFKPDLVHVWNLGGISKSLALTLQRLDIPTVYDVSDHWIARSLVGDVWLDWWNRETRSLGVRLARTGLTATGQRRALQQKAPTNPLRHLRFQRIYFCSQRLQDITLQAGYDVAHGEVIHCPVDIAAYHGRVRWTDQPLKKLLYAGRLSEDKGIFTALKAMQKVGSQFDGQLHVYGKGEADYVAMLTRYVRDHHLPVTFHSATPEQMPEVYRCHDALLFTSEWEEPFALTPLEAMASGLPVIGTLTGGSAELFKDGVNALTYAAGDADQLAQQLLLLDSDARLRESIALAGQALVRTKFHLKAIVTQIEDYLKETLRVWQPTSLPHYLAA
jgi:glycogen synthase